MNSILIAVPRADAQQPAATERWKGSKQLINAKTDGLEKLIGKSKSKTGTIKLFVCLFVYQSCDIHYQQVVKAY